MTWAREMDATHVDTAGRCSQFRALESPRFDGARGGTLAAPFFCCLVIFFCFRLSPQVICGGICDPLLCRGFAHRLRDESDHSGKDERGGKAKIKVLVLLAIEIHDVSFCQLGFEDPAANCGLIVKDTVAGSNSTRSAKNSYALAQDLSYEVRRQSRIATTFPNQRFRQTVTGPFARPSHRVRRLRLSRTQEPVRSCQVVGRRLDSLSHWSCCTCA